ncbi:Nuclear pore complex Nup98-Nup96 [Gossypium arboreum]|uniref:Nuclear pore complex Nup98-Nup96 n=1 Tax=Gossypium arboreum TaxID=29729 RepID=A0A0B0PMG9_GOSAR|nr:Nuclear pore complex Nup98-Nup96 [Gossypium arboreum]
MSGTCIGYKMCQCKTMPRTWHRYGYVRASCCLISSWINDRRRHRSHYQSKHLSGKGLGR